ncbi:TPA: hypothetical protein N0F65_007140 [Lagenidium giganteum]|uniref:Uncharacterized protein n=1 Tax=Lagenidium giganteum TaxID=4803 RepID=A0AAV2YYS6_9STRA|nr:TPA: hypothetical protein N0F65_007140 [Lagenidium giganteum]
MPVTAPDTHGVNMASSSFSASLPVNGSNTLASFNTSVAFYATNFGSGPARDDAQPDPAAANLWQAGTWIDRTDSMFLNSPSVAVIDGSTQNVTSEMLPGGDFVIMEFAFPKFTHLC